MPARHGFSATGDPETDTASIDGVSEGGEGRGWPTAPEVPMRLWPRGRQEAFASLDSVQLKNVFSRRPRLMRTNSLRSEWSRPPFPRQELSQEIARSEPGVPFDLDVDKFLICLRKSRRGAAGGPSGMTSEHLIPLLDNERDSAAFARVAPLMARREVPTSALEGIRLGRLTALKKPDGGVRGTVVGDLTRRLVARTIVKKVAKEAEQVTAPFQ